MQHNREKCGIVSGKTLFTQWILLTAFVTIAAILFTQSAFASSLGVAGDYSVFVFEDFTAPYGDVEGRLAAGGEVKLSSYSVGKGLSGVSSINTMVVGGDLAASNGQVNNGNVVVGGTATISGFNVKDGSLTQNAIVPIGFAAEESNLTSLSQMLSSITANGTVTTSGSTISLQGVGASSLQVFNISAEQLLSATEIKLTGVASDATVVINVSGTSVSMSYYGMETLKSIASNVLFNFYEAESLTILGSLAGTILATSADITAYNGHIYGSVIAESWTGGTEVGYVPFEGTIPSVPEPATLILLFSGLIGLAGLKRRMK